MAEWSWDKSKEEERINLASYVIFSKHSKAVHGFIEKAVAASHLPASSNDYHTTQHKRRELVEKIYNALCQQKLEYDLNEDYLFSNNQQIIRNPEEILNKHKGTCLDLAIMFCAICWHYDLLPILILLDGHALAAVSLTHRRREWKNSDRQGKEIFEDGRVSLTDAAIRCMVKREKYLAVECTGFAFSQTLENQNFPRKNGFLLFNQAIEFGSHQLEDKPEKKKLIFALDVQIAYYFWWAKLCRRRLEAEVPKTLTNNRKNLLQDIYVPLGLIKRKTEARRRPNKDLVNPEKSEFNQPDEKNEVVKEFENDEFFTQVLQHKNSTKSQGKRLVIVGDPGGGKSTLLQKIADWVITKEQGLPIWISLAKFNEKLVEEKDVNDQGWLYRYLSQSWLRDASAEPEKTPQILQQIFKEEILKSGQLWLMLDGADEMAVRHPLKKLKEQLAKGWADSVRVVLSCRLNFWEEQKDTLSEKFDTYRTLDYLFLFHFYGYD